MNDAAAESTPVQQELPELATFEEAAALLANRRTAESAPQSEASVETLPVTEPDGPPVTESTENETEGLLEEGTDEPEIEAESAEDHPQEIEEESGPVVYQIDGEQISEDQIRDWKRGYLRDADYTQKSQQLAADRKQLEASTQDLERLAQTYAFRLGEIDAGVNQELEQFNTVNWVDLASKDPQQYTALKAQHDAVMQRKQQIDQRTQEFMQQQQQMREGFMKRQAEQAQTELRQRMPEWNDALYYKLIDFGVQAYGFDRDIALKWTDPSTFEALRDAMRYREGQKVKTKKSVRTAPKKTLKSRATKPAAPKEQEVAKASFEQLSESGKMDDAVAALMARRQANRA